MLTLLVVILTWICHGFVAHQIECPTIPCQNGAKCQWNVCICRDGFRGQFCEKLDQDCPDVPCENGGWCDDNSCICPDGYHGQFCANYFINLGCFATRPHAVLLVDIGWGMQLERCAEACSELGYLYANVNLNFCYCADVFPRPSAERSCDNPCPGNEAQMCGRTDICSLQQHWTGVACPEECTITDAKVVGGFDCTCFEGRSKHPISGACEDIDECAHGDPCNPQAVSLPEYPTCENTEGSYRCVCPQGFFHNTETYNCDEIDECQDNRCSHGCVDGSGFFVCTCPEGFQLMANKLTCEDINECNDSVQNNCTGICLNQMGSFNCTCELGFTLEADGSTCTDIDECNTASPCEYICNNTHGSFTCSCKDAFVLNPDGRTCRDVNECSEWIDGDICEYECINVHGNHRCFCQSGYQPYEYIVDACPEISISGLQHQTSLIGNYSILPISAWCSDHVAYSQNNGLNYLYFYESGPYWLIGSLNCEGLPQASVGVSGYAHASDPSHIPTEVWAERFPGGVLTNDIAIIVTCNDESNLFTISKCNDIDECEDRNSYCEHTCNNTLGSYNCLCNDGYILSANGFNCIDVNECQAQSTHNCSQLCVNEDGGYSCSCMRGYELDGADGRNCRDIDECQTNNGGCLQWCNNTAGSYVCDCEHGYKIHVDGRFCMDIDECSIGEHNCSHECINYAGAYRCSCEEGFELADRFQCVDVDECSSTPCEHSCTNTNGSFVCSCKEGYALSHNGHGCVNKDECSEENKCSHICEDTDGSYVCSCNSGYELDTDNKTCSDINECSTHNGGCEQNCTNIDSGFSCGCYEGYSLGRDGSSCTDNNECSINGENICEQVCVNIDGNYMCGCYLGYKLDGQYTCTDVDECSTNTSLCEQSCTNTNGSYKCSCYAGYQLQTNQIGCTNINECSTGTAICQHMCTDIDGSYYCSCGPGYELDGADGRNCSDIDECQTNNGGCLQRCNNTAGSYVCDCEHGYKIHVDGSFCMDVDECSIGEHNCSQECINYAGAYRCSCDEGYELVDKFQCVDFNECSTTPCEHNCTNTNGSFVCSCKAGYALSHNGQGCVNKDECSEENNCSQICEDTGGSYVCLCNSGFILTSNGYSCDDINECSAYDNGYCDQICTNSAGSYHCECKYGYTLHIDGRTCKNKNECEYSNVCQHMCIDKQGGYTCDCRHGYVPDLTQNCSTGGCTGPYLCNDVNECTAETKPPCDHVCVNTEGSYNCSCLPGFGLSNDKQSCQDIDECLLNTARCSDQCTNNLGSYTCFCITPGTHLHPNQFYCIGPYYYTIQLPLNLQGSDMTTLSNPTSADFESLSIQIEAYLASLPNLTDVNISNILVNHYKNITAATIQRGKRQVTSKGNIMVVVTYDFSAPLTDLQIGVVFNNIKNEIINGGNSILINGKYVRVTGALQYIDNTNGTLMEWDVQSVCHLYDNKNMCHANSHCVEVNGLPTCNCSLGYNLNEDGECLSDAFPLKYILIIVGLVLAIALACSLAIIFQCIRTNFTDATRTRSEFTDDSSRNIYSDEYYTNQIYGNRNYQLYKDMHG